MSETDLRRLSELLSARLCHDLAGPIGALVAGSELLADDAEDEAMALLAQSAKAAASRLKLLRAAFGPANQDMAAAAVVELLREMLADARGGIGLDWDAQPAILSSEQARMILNLVLALRDALPRGGKIRVSGDFEAGMSVEATGQSLRADDLVQALIEGNWDVSPRAAQVWLAQLLAQASGLELSLRSYSEVLAIDIEVSKRKEVF